MASVYNMSNGFRRTSSSLFKRHQRMKALNRSMETHLEKSYICDHPSLSESFSLDGVIPKRMPPARKKCKIPSLLNKKVRFASPEPLQEKEPFSSMVKRIHKGNIKFKAPDNIIVISHLREVLDVYDTYKLEHKPVEKYIVPGVLAFHFFVQSQLLSNINCY